MYRMKKEISNQIKEYRYNRKLAEKVGVSEGYISQIVNGKKTRISKTMAYAITKALSANLEIENIFDVM